MYRRTKLDKPDIFGPYSLVDLDTSKCPRPCGPGLLIDYSLKGIASGPAALPRDPLVAVFEDDSDYLLGWTYLDFGFTRMGTPSYFLLIRDRKLDHDWASVHLNNPWSGPGK